MPRDIKNIYLYRIIPIENLVYDLNNGLYSKFAAPSNPQRVVIGNTEIISERDKRVVKCYPSTKVNDYVPFYFSMRTPMLYNIVTGHHGITKRNQNDIIYLCIPIVDLACDAYQWCFTDGNAAKLITKFFTELKELSHLDWKSIYTTDFRLDNSDGDEDRIRKKHSEFLVKDHVPANAIKNIVVFNRETKVKVEKIINSAALNINVYVNPKKKFYFNGIH